MGRAGAARPAVPRLGRRARWGLVVATAAVIGYASVLVVPSGDPAPPSPWLDEALHVLAYAALAGTLGYATATWTASSTRRAATVFALAVGYGLLVELAQGQVAYRQWSLLDALANAVGAGVGTALIAGGRPGRNGTV